MNRILIDTDTAGIPTGDLFGIFFEDLNHAADGGLYAEMVQNRSFEFSPTDHPSYHGLTAWEKLKTDGKIKIMVCKGDAVNSKNPHFLRIEVKQSGTDTGVKNTGFGSGMHFKQGETYRFCCYARCGDDACTVHISLRSAEGRTFARKALKISHTWQKYELMFEMQETERNGCMALTAEGEKTVDFDFVSLFPVDTYRGRENGMRKDIAEALAELKPKFMRFPGGCLVHDGSLDEYARDALYRWKNTIGPLEGRPARRNNWGYNQTLGLGYYEYFLFCEDVGAKPLPVLPAAYDPHHQRKVPFSELGPWLEETLDLIEFANGDSGTKWGSVRAGLGHPEPFGLEYIAIGNEEVGEGFAERFPFFVKAVREKYPQIKIIGSSGPFCAGGEFERGWKCAQEMGADLVDEHYYMAPEWFLEHMNRYTAYGEKGPKVFLGEYASWGNTAGCALTEAAYMTGLQNVVPVVGLACYAPLLCNADYINWKPDLIWFTGDKVCKTVNYEVQKLFMHHQGDVLLPWKLETEQKAMLLYGRKERLCGEIWLKSNQSDVNFTNISVINEDTGEAISYEDAVAGRDTEPVRLCRMETENYTVNLRAEVTAGWKGLRIYFAWKDEKNTMYWELGGWQNQDAIFAEEVHGKNSCLTQYAFSVEQGRTYELTLCIKNGQIEGWVDGTLLERTQVGAVEVKPLYVTAGRDTQSGDVIVKAVNLQKEAFDTAIQMPGNTKAEYLFTRYELAEASCEKCADFPDVETGNVCITQELRTAEEMVQFPGRSLTVLRMKLK